MRFVPPACIPIVAAILLLFAAAPVQAQSSDSATRVNEIVANAIGKIDKLTANFERKIASLTKKTRKSVDRMRYRDVDPAEINEFIAQAGIQAERLAYTYRSKAEAVLAQATKRLDRYGNPPGRLDEVTQRVEDHFDRILEVLDQLEIDLHDLEV